MIQVLLCATAFKTHADKGRPRNLLSQDPRRNHDRNANQGGCRPEPVPADPPEESQKGAPARSLRFCFPYSRPWREELREVDAEAGAVEASLSSGSQPDSSQHRSELSSSAQEERLSETFQVPSAPGVASSLTRNLFHQGHLQVLLHLLRGARAGYTRVLPGEGHSVGWTRTKRAR